MKYILISLIISIFANQIYSSYTPVTQCTDLETQWYGIFAQYTPELMQYCFYTMDYTNMAVTSLFDMEGDTNVIWEVNDKCEQMKPQNLIEGNCQKNGQLQLDYHIRHYNKNGQFLGQGDQNLMMYDSYHTNYRYLQGMTLVNVNSQDNFSQRIKEITNFQKTTCSNIQGQWYGKSLKVNTVSNQSCLYDITFEVTGGSQLIKLVGQSSQGTHAGETGSFEDSCNGEHFEFVGFCDESTGVLTLDFEQTVALFTDQFIVIQQNNEQFTLVRD